MLISGSWAPVMPCRCDAFLKREADGGGGDFVGRVQFQLTLITMAEDTIWSRTMSSVPASEESKTSVSVTSSSQSRTPAGTPLPEQVKAEEINEILKRTTRSLIRTLNFASTTQQQLTEVNLNVASSINERYNEIVELGSRIESAIAAIPKTVELPPNITERLLARIKALFEMMEIRQASLRKLITDTNSYLASANVGEMCETIEETHRRLLLLQKHIIAGRDLSVACPNEPIPHPNASVTPPQ